MCQRKSRMMYLNKTCLPLGLLLHFVSGLRGSVVVDNQGNICPDNRSGRYLLKKIDIWLKKKLTFDDLSLRLIFHTNSLSNETRKLDVLFMHC